MDYNEKLMCYMNSSWTTRADIFPKQCITILDR